MGSIPIIRPRLGVIALGTFLESFPEEKPLVDLSIFVGKYVLITEAGVAMASKHRVALPEEPEEGFVIFIEDPRDLEIDTSEAPT